MQSTIKGILNGVVVICLVVWLLRLSSGLTYLSQFKVGKQDAANDKPAERITRSSTNTTEHGRLRSAGDFVRNAVLFVIGSALSVGAFAQINSQTTIVAEPIGPVSTFRVIVTTSSVDAINYRHRDGVTDVDLAGTALMSSADGKAKVRSKRGTMEVEAEFGNLQNPTTFGTEYLTYVLWAISPEGRAVNLGEVLVGGNDRSKLTATTDLQAFALIVTAEPYFAVRQPSNAIVLRM
jgi:hypothetical protein